MIFDALGLDPLQAITFFDNGVDKSVQDEDVLFLCFTDSNVRVDGWLEITRFSLRRSVELSLTLLSCTAWNSEDCFPISNVGELGNDAGIRGLREDMSDLQKEREEKIA